MRNLLLILMILGMLAGIGAAYFGITERQKAIEAKDDAVTDKDKAVDKQKSAVKERDDAVKQKKEAEEKTKSAQDEQERSKILASTAEQKVQDAEKAKEEAVSKESQANKKHDEMKIKMENALTEATQAKKERDEAAGNAEGAELMKVKAETLLTQTTDDMEKMQKELNDIKELTAKVAKLTVFINKFTNILINNIQSGDDTFVEGLDLFLSAETVRDKAKAIKLIGEAGKKYQTAKDQIDKLDVDPTTEDIIKTMSSGVTENITCIKETSDALTALAQNANPNNPAMAKERYNKFINIRRRKEKADSLMSDICGNILKLIEENKGNILPSQVAIIKRAEENFYQRWRSRPENPEESTSAIPTQE